MYCNNNALAEEDAYGEEKANRAYFYNVCRYYVQSSGTKRRVLDPNPSITIPRGAMITPT